mgnify:FL=1|tara:strand:+ start:908 stop:1009 length:102 start_codon:yes stop_codon:yes gene_type:complete
MDSHEQVYIRNPKFRDLKKEQEDEQKVSESSKE